MSKNKSVRVIDKFFILFILIPLLIAGVAIYVKVSANTETIKTLKNEEKEPRQFFPVSNSVSIDTAYLVDCYSDITDPGGASTISRPVVTDSIISCGFTLRPGVDYPYAGLYISRYSSDNDPTGTHFDFSDYTDIEIEIESKNAQSFFMYIKTKIEQEDVNLEKLNEDHAPFRKEVHIEDGKAVKRLKFKDFSVPSWWKDENTPEVEDLLMNLDKVQQIDFANGNNKLNPENELIDIAIKKITLIKDNSEIVKGIANAKQGVVKYNIIIGVILALYFIVIGLWKSGKLREMLPVQEDDDSEKIIISYDKVEMKDEQEDELERITEQIAKNYSSPTFSVEQLAKEAGVSTTKIPALLKHKYSMNFKQYLNMVRVTEAKRLLLETDHQIVTIAHSVGYNNIPHFNRTFKQHTGLSPKKYRKEPELAENNIPGSQSNKDS